MSSAWAPPPPAGSRECCTVPCTDHIVWAPEACDPVGVCKTRHARRCAPFAPPPPAPAPDVTGHYDADAPPPMAPTAAAGDKAGSSSGAWNDPTGATGAMTALGGAAAAFTGSALTSMSSALTLPPGCPVCGHVKAEEPPGLQLPRGLAAWLVTYGGGRVEADDFTPASDLSRVWLSRSVSDSFQCGREVGHLLSGLLARTGRSLPFSAEMLRGGADPRTRLLNWALLEPVLSSFDVDLNADARTLIVAGDRETLAALLTHMRARIGSPKYGAKAAIAAAPPPVEEAAPAEALDHVGEETPAEAQSAERKELLADSVSQLIGLYSIVMACMLSLFVEQTCASGVAGAPPRQCTLQNDFNSPYERAVLAVNFACLAALTLSQIVFWLREKFIIEHFAETEELPGDNLPVEIAAYPAYLYTLRVHNKRAYYASEVAFVALLVNFGLSGYLILDKRYAGRTSIIGLLSNTFLCLGKVYAYRTLAKESCDLDMAMSLFESEARNKNTIEPDKRKMEGVYDPEGAPALRRSMTANRSAAAIKPLPPGPPRVLAPSKSRARWAEADKAVASTHVPAAAKPPPSPPPPPSAPPAPPARVASARTARAGMTAPPPPPPPSMTRLERRL